MYNNTLLQYKIDKRNGVFEVYAFTIDGKPQTIEMIDSLIESMCEVVSLHIRVISFLTQKGSCKIGY